MQAVTAADDSDRMRKVFESKASGVSTWILVIFVFFIVLVVASGKSTSWILLVFVFYIVIIVVAVIVVVVVVVPIHMISCCSNEISV